MEAQIITIFCVIDDILKCIKFFDDKQAKISTAEIMTVVITAGLIFGGNHQKARAFFLEQRYVKNILSKSQFNRRLHAIDESIWEAVNFALAQVFIDRNASQEYAVDSFPVEACHNIRIRNSKIYKGEEYRGKCVSKREYFWGIKVHMIVTKTGEPIEFVFAPGAYHDSRIFKCMSTDLPKNSKIYADSGYTDYDYEDALNEADLKFLPARKSNSKRPHSGPLSFLISSFRKIIETTFSQITYLFPRTIHAVTSKGFELKVFTFILAFSFSCL